MHTSSYRWNPNVREQNSGAISSEVRISYFDPITGEPCDTKPKPRPKTPKPTSLERDKQRIKAEKEAAKVVRNMEERRKAEKNAKKKAAKKNLSYVRDMEEKREARKIPVLVDGVRFLGYEAAAKEIGTTRQHLGNRMREGATTVKGRKVEYDREH